MDGRAQARHDGVRGVVPGTEEDFRNRQRRDDYVAAVDEMVARTHTDHALWHLISANDKRVARIEVLKRANRALETALERSE